MTDVPATGSTPPRNTPRTASRGLWILIVILLLPPIVIPLWVPLYDKTDPTLWGFPFFYWFQFAMILFSAVMTLLAYTVSLMADRRDAATAQDGDR
jgi:Protein of unknown function (DUF3311)